jgi:non-ribosomal peptide synthetase component F/acyl carrier protein
MSDPGRVPLSPRRTELFEKLLRAEGIDRSSAQKVWPRPDRAAPVPLTFPQSRLWFLDQFTADRSAFVISATLMVHGKLQLDSFARACDEVVRRHESLRTVFSEIGGRPFQQVRDDLRADVRIVDLSGLEPDAVPAELQRREAELADRPFDLGAGPLLRVQLVRLAPDTTAVLLVVHHIVADLWSIAVLMRELRGSYEAAVSLRASALPELPVQYPDFALWQRESSSETGWQPDLAYWRGQLAGIPLESGLRTDRSRPREKTYRGSSVPIELAPTLVAGLRELARAERATPFMVLVAAFSVLVSRLGDSEDIVLGTPVANRPLSELEPLIGFFVNTLALRTDLTGNPSFRSVLRDVRRTCLEAFEHQNLPFERLVEDLQPERSRARTPLFQVMIAYRNVPIPAWTEGSIRVDPVPPQSRKAEFDLLLDLFEDGDTIWGRLEYSLDVFEEASAHRMVRLFQRLLRGAISDPDQRVGQLPLMGPDERRRVMAMGAGPEPERAGGETSYVLDRCLQLVPVGVAGELFIGAGSATEEHLVTVTFEAGTSVCLFRTGELARYRADGALERLGRLGRLDRQVKVPAVPVEPSERWTAFEAPRDDLEQSIAAIWSELLGVTQVGVNDDFFELGGHSMIATQLASQITAAQGIQLPIRELFDNPTVAELAAWIREQRKTGEGSAAIAIPAADRAQDLPLSFAQEHLCLHHPWGVEHEGHNVVTGILLKGALDEALLERSLIDVASRHEALRTRIVGRSPELVQQVLSVASWPLAVVDLRAVPQSTRPQELRRLVEAEVQRRFRIDVGPLVRGTLVRLADDESALVLVMHHLVTDNWSYGVLVRDLCEFYQARSAGRKPVLPELVIHYPDYAAWQRRELARGALDDQLGYWRRQLKDPPALCFEAPGEEEGAEPATGCQQSFMLDVSLARALNEIARQEGATLFMVLLAAFAVLLSANSGTDDISISFPEAGRERPETTDLVGFFVSIGMIRADLSGAPSFRELVAQVRESTFDGYAHRGASPCVLDQEPGGDLGSARIRFNLLNAPVPAIDLPGLVVESLDIGDGYVFSEVLLADLAPAEVDLALIMREHESGLRGTWLYSLDKIDTRALSSIMSQWAPLIERVAADPDLAVGRLRQ